MHPDRYQIALVSLGILAAILFGYFLYREIFPEYRIYQSNYIALEEFRSSYTGEPPPDFNFGVKQIVFEREDKGPAKIDRCTSCHVAIQLPHFSPTKIELDINGNIVRSEDGTPKQAPNEDYVWGKLDQKVAELTDPAANAQLEKEGQYAKVAGRIEEAARLKSLKTAWVGDHLYDVTKVLSMHPLIGKETRPFEFHPIEEYGCTSCHSGNGRGLTTEKAHGPVFDGEYEAEYMGPKPQFKELDPQNDPQFARVFNDKPGGALLFQTTPILVGNLIQSSCVQCHVRSSSALQGLADTAASLTAQRKQRVDAIKEGYEDEKEALLSLLRLKRMILDNGLSQAIADVQKMQSDFARSAKERERLAQQVVFLKQEKDQESALNAIDDRLIEMLGTKSLEQQLEKELETGKNPQTILDRFIEAKKEDPKATGSLFAKWRAINLERALLSHVKDTQQSLAQTVGDERVVSAMTTDIDWLTKNYHRGEQLYLSQACYACHRIAGMARGGIGPELTHAGNSYPWFLKESIVWPQADLRTSTMPNFVLDHVEVEDLMTFLLAQKGANRAVSETEYRLAIQDWESGRKKMPWEKPISPSQIQDLRYSMTVFATEGCAACHRLEGYESNVGYRIEKGKKPPFEDLYQEKQWFRTLFPENILGSAIVRTIEQHADEIDRRIVDDVRENSILEEIQGNYPEAVEALYSNFRFASRAKNTYFKQLADQTEDPKKREQVLKGLEAWKDRVKRVLMMYVQEYGLGRLIGPRPNWSGIYRSDEWLMEHFRNPASHVPRSIMPVMPFDDSKFFALTYMLDVLGKRNRDAVRAIWQHKGFDPEQAFDLFCAQCHGNHRQGDGPVSVWIYPVPKNLRNIEFLRNLTRTNVIQSIVHGVKGTPMPPWGEAPKPKPGYDGIPVLTADEIEQLVDWLYSAFPGGSADDRFDIPKWEYTPQDVLEELRREGGQLKSSALHQRLDPDEVYFASADPFLLAQAPPDKDAVSQVFNIVPNPIPGGEKHLYYIKKKYYTEENLEKGQQFFELNCAVCHGREGDGTGARAGVMVDAKPRMLTNLDWLKTRDDMRLLRSIKFGVAGTSMTPWGDQTSSLQRLQLVMYIRTLSEEKDMRDALFEKLYGAFDFTQTQIDEARILEYPVLEALRTEYQAVQRERQIAYRQAQEESGSFEKAVALYQRQLELAGELKQSEMFETLLGGIRRLIANQRDIFQGVGNDMIAAAINDEEWPRFLKIIELNAGYFSFEDGRLSINSSEEKEQQMQELAEKIVSTLDRKLDALQREREVIEGRLPSPDRGARLRTLQARVNTINKVKSRLLSGLAENEELRRQEAALFEQFRQMKEDDKRDNRARAAHAGTGTKNAPIKEMSNG